MRSLDVTAALALGAMFAAGCGGGSSHKTKTADPASLVQVPPNATAPERYETADFRPPLRMTIPHGWLTAERGSGSLQLFIGAEVTSPVEITFDDSLAHRTPRDALARLRGAPGMRAGAAHPIVYGVLRGIGFDADKVRPVRFSALGYHTQAGGTLRVAVFRLRGTTVTLILDVTHRRDTRRGLALAAKVLRTVRVASG